jgi:hypothetical protein
VSIESQYRTYLTQHVGTRSGSDTPIGPRFDLRHALNGVRFDRIVSHGCERGDAAGGQGARLATPAAQCRVVARLGGPMVEQHADRLPRASHRCGAFRTARIPIRTLAVAATDNARRAPGTGRWHRLREEWCASRQPVALQAMDEGAFHPARIPIRPLAVAVTDHGRRAPERAAGIGMREAPAILLGCGRRRSEAAALTMGRG